MGEIRDSAREAYKQKDEPPWRQTEQTRGYESQAQRFRDASRKVINSQEYLIGYRNRT